MRPLEFLKERGYFDKESSDEIISFKNGAALSIVELLADYGKCCNLGLAKQAGLEDIERLLKSIPEE